MEYSPGDAGYVRRRSRARVSMAARSGVVQEEFHGHRPKAGPLAHSVLAVSCDAFNQADTSTN
jgi:hypothetical protein